MFDVHAPGEYPGYKVVTCTFKYQWGMNVVLPREVLEEAPHVAVEMVAKRLFMALAEQVEQESVKAVQKACKDCGYKVPSTEALDGTVEGMAHTFLKMVETREEPVPAQEILEVTAIIEAGAKSAGEKNRMVDLTEVMG